ncbi:hypothetical protein ACFE04_021408 [Oxalis oulophora]
MYKLVDTYFIQCINVWSLTTPPLTTAVVPSPPPLAPFAPSSVLISVASLLPEAEQEARQELPPVTVKHPRFLKVAENFFIALQSDERVNYQLDVKFQEFYLSKVVNLLQCQLSEGATSSKNSKGEGNENGICKNGIDAEDVGKESIPIVMYQHNEEARRKGRDALAFFGLQLAPHSRINVGNSSMTCSFFCTIL